MWSKHYPRCQGCGTTDRFHHARGFCHQCYDRQINHPEIKSPPATLWPRLDSECQRWARRFPCCQHCGTVAIAHHARGLCRNCYNPALRIKKREFRTPLPL